MRTARTSICRERRAVRDASDDPRHAELLAAAQRLQRRALEGDADALHAELCRLRNALTEHVRREEEVLAGIPEPARAVVNRGQRDLVDQIDRLLGGDPHGDEGCRCHVHAVRLTRALARQARLEADMLA